jgi:23S rRNA (adenine1618-N6)-methyltransferase
MAEIKLHARNKHKHGYDFSLLCEKSPDLTPHVFTNQYQNQTIDFSNNKAVLALNHALLMTYYDIEFWDIPEGALCPPIPGRADYIHYLADLLKETNNGKIPHKQTIQALDIGTGANCIYPIIGATQYKWDFVGTDISENSLASANKIIQSNPALVRKVNLVHQAKSQQIFKGIIKAGQYYDITLCNPPFHSSAKEASAGTVRKWKNLQGEKSHSNAPPTQLNFGGHHNELWCDGGELTFIKNMIKESQLFSTQVLWFSCLVSKKEHLRALQLTLKKAKNCKVKIIRMTQGQKTSRFIAWSFLTNEEKQEWCSSRFS